MQRTIDSKPVYNYDIEQCNRLFKKGIVPIGVGTNNNSGKEDIIVFAKNYEKTCGITEKIVQSEKANVKRSISAKYNNLRWHFDRYSKQYSNNELIEIYKQIHHDNELINKEIKGAITGSDYQKKLMKKLRDEEIFNDIPCIVDYIEKKKSTAIISRNNNYNEDIWGEPDAVGL